MNRIRSISFLPCILLLLVTPTFFLNAGTDTARAASSQICGTWNTTFSLNPSTSINQFNGIATLAANDVWAVGYYDSATTSAQQTVTEHWNGSHWALVASPNTGQESALQGVAASSATTAWAVGHSVDNIGGPSHALIEQWNGTSWNIAPNPTAPSESELLGVTISSPNNVWAVGDYTTSSGTSTLIEQWDGTSWSVVPDPNPVSPASTLSAVAHVEGTNQIWAVGFYYAKHNRKTLIERWDGTSWRIIASPDPGSDNELEGVTTISAHDIWAVGFSYSATNALASTLTEHWNGSQWSVVPSPNTSSSDNQLSGVTAVSSTNVWAVGFYNNSPEQTLTEQWNGSSWNIIASANKGKHHNTLFAVSAIGRTGEVWAVGTYNLGKSFSPPYRTLAEFYC